MTRNRKKALLMGAFFVGLLQGLVAGSAYADFCPVPPGEPVAVAHVSDGDTVRLSDGRWVRLIGLNTPELARDGRAAEPGAEAARAFLHDMVSAVDGRARLALGEESRDRYGRWLGHLILGQTLASERMLEQGLGFAVAVAPNTALARCLFQAENEARVKREGVWDAGVQRAAKSIEQTGFVLAQGVVTQVDRAGKAFYVELDDHLVIRVPVWSVKDEIYHWKGRRLEVRGWVVDRGRNLKPGRKRWLISISDSLNLRLLAP